VTHRTVNGHIGNIGERLVVDTSVNQGIQNLVHSLTPTTFGLLTFCLKGRSPEEIPQVTVRERLQVPASVIFDSVEDSGGIRVGPRYNAIPGARERPVYVTGDGITGTPVLVVEGRKLASHCGSDSWLSAKVDSELPGPIVFLYTGGVNLMPSTADWLRLSRSSDGPTE